MKPKMAGLCVAVLAGMWSALLGSCQSAPSAVAQAKARSDVRNGLKVSDNRRYLVDAKTGQPVFMLADTAWNLGALTLEEIDVYLKSRTDHGFNTVMFALNFAPQAEAKNAYGHAAYIGPDNTELNPAYFQTCDAIVKKCAERGLYVMLYAMWAGKTAGTMNNYTAAQLHSIGRELGRRYRGVKHVILCTGGESTPHYIAVEPVDALGRGLKEGCAGENLVTVHPVSEHSTSEFFASAAWLDFYLSQGKSSSSPASLTFDAPALVSGDYRIAAVKPTMMVEHRYETGTAEDPHIQRRGLYQCVFAGGFGYAYGHNALWQMTPHTGQPWMLKSWNPGVPRWNDALDTASVRQLKHIQTLLYAFPFLERIPDQSLVLAGQGDNLANRVQALRDGSAGHDDATYLMAYLTAPRAVTLKTRAIAGRRLNVYWFNPATAAVETLQEDVANPGLFTVEERADAGDGVIVIEDASKNYRRALR